MKRDDLVSAPRICGAKAALSGLLFALTLGSCLSREEGEALRRDLETLKTELRQEKESAEAQRAELKQVIEKTTQLLTRSNADVGVQVERVQNINATLRGRVEELQRALAEIGTKLKEQSAKSTPQPEKAPDPNRLSADQLIEQAKSKAAVGNQVARRQLLRVFLGRFATDSRAAQAQHQIGDSYYLQQKFAAAAVEYRKVLKQYPKSAVHGDALYKVGMSFYQLKYCGDARSFLERFVRQHRDHANRDSARRILKLIRRYRRNRQFCSS